MTEERITTTQAPDGATHTTHTTVISDEPRRRGGLGLATVLLLLAALAIGLYLFSQMSGAEVAKDNAIGNAADSVSAAANDVGDAARDLTSN